MQAPNPLRRGLVEDRTGDHAGEHQGQNDMAEGLPRVRAQIAGGFQQ